MNAEPYLELRRAVALKKVSLGYRTVTLFDRDELEEAQVGYSVSPIGEALVGTGEGDWKSSWLVIAHEDELGDPIFTDLQEPRLPVLTAPHGEGEWLPEMIASSFQGFIEALEEIERISYGRTSPVELERNPLSVTEKEQVLGRIDKVIGHASPEFWEDWIGLSTA